MKMLRKRVCSRRTAHPLPWLLLAAIVGGGCEKPSPAEPAKQVMVEKKEDPPAKKEPKPFPPWHFAPGHEPKAKEPVKIQLPNSQAELSALRGRKDRCEEGMRKSLVILRGLEKKLALPLAQIDELPAIQKLEAQDKNAKNKGRRSLLPLATLLEKATRTAEIWPCHGEVLSLPAKELRKNPKRFLLKVTGKGTLKLIDTQEDERRARLKNLALLRLL